MSKNENENLSNDDGEKIGYCKPPQHSRFKKGTSGNPSGRPAGSKNRPPHPDELLSMIEAEAFRPISVVVEGKATKMPTTQAILRSVNVKAAKGDPASQRLAIDLSLKVRDRRETKNDQLFAAAVAYKADYKEECKTRREQGLPPRDVFLHPDDIILDYETGTVTCLGMTPDQEELLAHYHKLKASYEVALQKILSEEISPQDMPDTLDEIRHIVRVLKGVCKNLGIP